MSGWHCPNKTLFIKPGGGQRQPAGRGRRPCPQPCRGFSFPGCDACNVASRSCLGWLLLTSPPRVGLWPSAPPATCQAPGRAVSRARSPPLRWAARRTWLPHSGYLGLGTDVISSARPSRCVTSKVTVTSLPSHSLSWRPASFSAQRLPGWPRALLFACPHELQGGRGLVSGASSPDGGSRVTIWRTGDAGRPPSPRPRLAVAQPGSPTRTRLHIKNGRELAACGCLELSNSSSDSRTPLAACKTLHRGTPCCSQPISHPGE